MYQREPANPQLAGICPCYPRLEVPVRDRAQPCPPHTHTPGPQRVETAGLPAPMGFCRAHVLSHKQLSGTQIKRSFIGRTDTNKCQAPREMSKQSSSNVYTPHIGTMSQAHGHVLTKEEERSPTRSACPVSRSKDLGPQKGG